ncbi:MAG: efflux RND transporter periplasmic adaptor subunit [Gammaproteobacteria bacterium]|nr:efflux RND transporter periplasmic adaptor subunit [Gammaproteobacteria bacterium]
MQRPDREQTIPGAGSDAGDLAYLDPALWSRLTEADSPEAFAAAWLDIQCGIIGGVQAAVVVLGEPDEGPFVPLAARPADAEPDAELAAVAELAMDERRGVVRAAKSGAGLDTLAYPVLVDEQLCGVAALAVGTRGDEELRGVMRQLQWGVAWLEVLARRKTFATRPQLAAVLEMISLTLEHERYRGAVAALATELATRLGCDRVSVGFRRGRHTRVDALSHSADFGHKSNLMRAVGAAMDEAVDQHEAVVYPQPEDGQLQVTRAQAELARLHGAGAVCSIPFGANGKLLGALTLERPADRPFDRATVSHCARLAALMGPMLEVKRREDRWLITKIGAAGRDLLAALLGPGHLALKLAALALVSLGTFMALATGTYRVTADAALEGTVQRVVTAPMNGYVADAGVRAGDVVRAGEVLAVLDDRDLVLERQKWDSQRRQRLREYSKALAAHDRAQVRILGAQVDQAEAQIALIDEQLRRAQLVAPFDGLVVRGDLSQRLGSPVERGQVLFEVAPLEAYRIILEVDERDISQVAVGQRGSLALSSLPGETLPLEVERITPVSTTEEGRNYFRVEAMLSEPGEGLHPGMEGVGKIDVGERKLWWIWTHKLVSWVRMSLWSWWA